MLPLSLFNVNRLHTNFINIFHTFTKKLYTLLSPKHLFRPNCQNASDNVREKDKVLYCNTLKTIAFCRGYCIR